MFNLLLQFAKFFTFLCLEKLMNSQPHTLVKVNFFLRTDSNFFVHLLVFTFLEHDAFPASCCVNYFPNE